MVQRDFSRPVALTGAALGSLHIQGGWFDRSASVLTLAGTLDGHAISLTVPAT